MKRAKPSLHSHGISCWRTAGNLFLHIARFSQSNLCRDDIIQEGIRRAIMETGGTMFTEDEWMIFHLLQILYECRDINITLKLLLYKKNAVCLTKLNQVIV